MQQQPTIAEQRIGAYVVAFICKTILLSMGICLLLPAETFAASPRGYAVFLATGVPEPLWGLYGVVLGALGLWSLRPDALVQLRVGCGIVGGISYVGLSIIFLIANSAGLIAWIFMPLAILDFFSLPYLGMKE